MHRKVPDAMLVAMILAGLCLAVATAGEAGRVVFRYERDGLETGQLWRLLTAHVVHLSWSHTGLNVVALLLLGGIFAPFMRMLEWLVVLAGAALAIDLGLYVLDPEVEWYVGLSGALHGMFAAGVLALPAKERVFALMLGAGLCIKLGVEAWGGPLAATAALTGGDVVTEAHLYGTIGGTAAMGLLAIVASRRPPL